VPGVKRPIIATSTIKEAGRARSVHRARRTQQVLAQSIGKIKTIDPAIAKERTIIGSSRGWSDSRYFARRVLDVLEWRIGSSPFAREVIE
jgi:hypothetical protein